MPVPNQPLARPFLGMGYFTISGAGELFLTATNVYTGTTTISGATLFIGNGGVTGSISWRCSRQRNARV